MPRGHAIECRINAENYARGFLPSPGQVTGYHEPAGPGVRVDSSLAGPGLVSPNYDPMIAKLIVHAPTRHDALDRMRRALLEYVITGIQTNIPYHLAVIADPEFREGDVQHRIHRAASRAGRRRRRVGGTAGAISADRARPCESRGDRCRRRRLEIASVEPRYGRLYSATVLRPLAEQLVAELGVRAGETVCDLLCDLGMLGGALAGAVGNTGRVVLVDSDVALPNAGSCDRVGSLCTFGFWTGTSMLDVAVRITRPGGVAAVLTWDPDDPPAHERALVDALRDVVGIDSPFLRECLAAPAAGELDGWDVGRLHDVVRFDGIAQYWVAMVLERPLLSEVDGASEQTVSALRRACEAGLRPCIAADGTMRIPVTATLWRRTRGIGD